MSKSKIEWTEETWNPTTGCNKVSAGCKFCYAEALSAKLKDDGQKKYRNGFDFTNHPETLKYPYGWKEPKLVFVNSMSDLFHEKMPLDFLKQVFEVMNKTPWHTYQILTKRPEIVLQYNNEVNWTPNIWMGVSVEDEQVVDRIDLLKKNSAKTKFLSIEPLIGPLPKINLEGIGWVIVGGESGVNARPMKPEWAIEVRNQCQEAHVPFFFKQWGKPDYNPDPYDPTIKYGHSRYAKGGCLLEGKIWREMPVMKSFENRLIVSNDFKKQK